MKRMIVASRNGKQFIDYLNDMDDSAIEDALKDIDLGALSSKIADKYDWVYLYQVDKGDNPDDYYEMLGVGDWVLANFGWFVRDLASVRNDVLSSDREIAALGYALETMI